jgi:HK97 gp10 family phage protein
MSNAVIVKGMRELEKQLKQFDKEIHRELKSTLKQTVKEVAADAKANAPTNSGEYKASITSAIARSGLIAWAYASRKNDSKRGYLGHLLEYGTVKMKARPHFGPALDKAKSAFGARLQAAIKRVRGSNA